jgi:hypothetical protein
MELKDFIPKTIAQIMEGLSATDELLKGAKTGSIYKKPFQETMAQTLVNLGIVKGNDKEPVIVVRFDVALAIEEQTGQSDKAHVGVSAPLLSVIGVKGGVEGHSSESQKSSHTHRLTFSVPVSFATND